MVNLRLHCRRRGRLRLHVRRHRLDGLRWRRERAVERGGHQRVLQELLAQAGRPIQTRFAGRVALLQRAVRLLLLAARHRRVRLVRRDALHDAAAQHTVPRQRPTALRPLGLFRTERCAHAAHRARAHAATLTRRLAALGIRIGAALERRSGGQLQRVVRKGRSGTGQRRRRSSVSSSAFGAVGARRLRGSGAAGFALLRGVVQRRALAAILTGRVVRCQRVLRILGAVANRQLPGAGDQVAHVRAVVHGRVAVRAAAARCVAVVLRVDARRAVGAVRRTTVAAFGAHLDARVAAALARGQLYFHAAAAADGGDVFSERVVGSDAIFGGRDGRPRARRRFAQLAMRNGFIAQHRSRQIRAGSKRQLTLRMPDFGYTFICNTREETLLEWIYEQRAQP